MRRSAIVNWQVELANYFVLFDWASWKNEKKEHRRGKVEFDHDETEEMEYRFSCQFVFAFSFFLSVYLFSSAIYSLNVSRSWRYQMFLFTEFQNFLELFALNPFGNWKRIRREKFSFSSIFSSFVDEIKLNGQKGSFKETKKADLFLYVISTVDHQQGQEKSWRNCDEQQL